VGGALRNLTSIEQLNIEREREREKEREGEESVCLRTPSYSVLLLTWGVQVFDAIISAPASTLKASPLGEVGTGFTGH
jgi:hypothetical protein